MEQQLTMPQRPIFTRQQIIRLIVPLMVEQFLAITIGMADSVMVATVGEAAVSGVSLVDSINVLLINIFSALATGGAIVASQYIGRQDHKSANVAASQLISIVAVFSTSLMIVCELGNVHILRLLFGQTEASVMRNCTVYFFWSALSYPFIAVYNAGAALFRAMGNSKISMFTSLAMNGVNICGNAILIFGFKMGVAGAAIATLVARMLGACVMILLLRRRDGKIYLDSMRSFLPDAHMIRNILYLGIPTGLENGMFQIGKILVLGLVSTFGTSAIAANSVGNSISQLTLIPSSAIGLGVVTIVGRCVGAGEYDQAKRYTLKLTGLAYIALSALSVLLMIFSRPLVSIYALEPHTTDLACQILFFFGVFSILLWPSSFTIPNGLRAASDVRFTMTVSVGSMWVFRIGCSYLFCNVFHMGVEGVWFGMYADWLVRAVCFWVRIMGSRWKQHQMV